MAAKRCATPKCTTRRGHGTFGNFCAKCARNLARIRTAYLAEAASHNPSFAKPCRTSGCGEPRRHGAYCAVCRAMDLDEAA